MIFDIGYTVSNKYAPMLAVSIASLCKNVKHDDIINLYILTSELNEENKRKINKLKSIHDFNIEYINMNDQDFSEIAAGIGMVSNYRLKIASIKQNLDKILFLDSDIVFNNSIEELWNTDLGDNYIAAVIDPGVKLQYDYTFPDKEKFPDKRYNTGVMLINLKKWREDNLEEKIIEGAKWYSTKYNNWPDQNVLNMVCKGKIYNLDYKYNVCPILNEWGYYQEEGVWEEASQNPIILHFCAYSVFKDKLEYAFMDVFWEYAKLTPYYEILLSESIDYKYQKKSQDRNTNKYINLKWENHTTAIAMSSSEEYIPYLSVYLQSLIEHSSKNNYYDIIIFSTTDKKSIKDTITQKYSSENISI